MVGLLIGLMAGAKLAGFADDVLRALELARVSQKAACLDMRIDKGQWHRDLRAGRVSFATLTQIESEEFWKWLSLLQAKRHGWPMDVQAALDLQPRMVRMNLLESRRRGVA